MYYGPKEHNPPHIHIYYQGKVGILNIETLEFTSGNIASKQQRLVLAWAEIHSEELLADWELCQNGEKPFSIEPLK
jgi:hypothetical protein